MSAWARRRWYGCDDHRHAEESTASIETGMSWLGPAIHPGEMLLEEYLKPLGVGQVEAARQLGVSLNRLNEIVLGKRGITADTALRLGRLLIEDFAAALDAAAGRLGSAPGHGARGAEGVLTCWWPDA
jgi:addiction module HigA family antidote